MTSADQTDTTDQRVLADQIVVQLRKAVSSGAYDLETVPRMLRYLLENDLWRERYVRDIGLVQFSSFTRFVQTPPLEGLGTTLDALKRLCSHDLATLSALDRVAQAEQRPGERTDLLDIVKEVDADDSAGENWPHGNERQYAIRKLRTSRPDLHEKVLAGELSPHAAMIAAGFRRRTLTVPAEPVGAIRALLRHFSADELRTALDQA